MQALSTEELSGYLYYSDIIEKGNLLGKIRSQRSPHPNPEQDQYFPKGKY
jgi:hypothetical protein